MLGLKAHQALKVQKVTRAIPDLKVQRVQLEPLVLQVRKDRKVFRDLKEIQEIQVRKDRQAPLAQQVLLVLRDRKGIQGQLVRRVQRGLRAPPVLQVMQQLSLLARLRQALRVLAPPSPIAAQVPPPSLISASRRVPLEQRAPPEQQVLKVPKAIQVPLVQLDLKAQPVLSQLLHQFLTTVVLRPSAPAWQLAACSVALLLARVLLRRSALGRAFLYLLAHYRQQAAAVELLTIKSSPAAVLGQNLLV